MNNCLENRKERLERASPSSSAYTSTGSSTGDPLLNGLEGSPPGLRGRHSFEVSIGQDVADKEASVQEERRRSRDLLEHSYSSLSDYHSHKQ